MDILDYLLTADGVYTLFLLFIPGFILLSCTKHWFRKEGDFRLSDLEIIFWSIPLSLFISLLCIGSLSGSVTAHIDEIVIAGVDANNLIQTYSIFLGCFALFFFLYALHFFGRYVNESENLWSWINKPAKERRKETPQLYLLVFLVFIEMLLGWGLMYSSLFVGTFIGTIIFVFAVFKALTILGISYKEIKRVVSSLLKVYYEVFLIIAERLRVKK